MSPHCAGTDRAETELWSGAGDRDTARLVPGETCVTRQAPEVTVIGKDQDDVAIDSEAAAGNCRFGWPPKVKGIRHVLCKN